MKEHPILFSPAMIKAIFDGRKTQTRRVIRKQPTEPYQSIVKCPQSKSGFAYAYNEPGWCSCVPVQWCPCQKGDLLRETTCIAPKRFATPDDSCISDLDGDLRYVSYKADGHSEEAMREYGLKWTPSIHVPKWAARIWLKVKDIRVERLQDIAEQDAKAEGLNSFMPYYDSENSTGNGFINAFANLWDSINKSSGYGWDTNPWVWVVEFERTDKPETK